MQMSGYESMQPTAGGGAAAVLDVLDVITRVSTPEDARALSRGSIVGDTHGGLTFTDAVAYVLERRSQRGWYEALGSDGQRWTIIHLNR
jgi:hypothetical protein